MQQFKFEVIHFDCCKTTYNIKNYKTVLGNSWICDEFWRQEALLVVASPPLQVIPLIRPFLYNIRRVTLPSKTIKD